MSRTAVGQATRATNVKHMIVDNHEDDKDDSAVADRLELRYGLLCTVTHSGQFWRPADRAWSREVIGISHATSRRTSSRAPLRIRDTTPATIVTWTESMGPLYRSPVVVELRSVKL